MRRRGPALLLVLAALAPAATAAVPATAAAQQPDTIPDDTIPGDTLPPGPPPADTVPADTLPADTLPPDTIVETLPELPPAVPSGRATAVWAWDREELVSNRAMTLAELVEQVTGVLPLRGGDYGTPRAATAFAAGAGGVRVFRDGMEVLPLEGSVPDLSRVGLGSLESVRVERSAAGLRIELRTLRPDDVRPYSRIEAGTGDLDTNLLRGVFLHPRALGGNIALALDRIDTQGTGRRQPGAVTSFWLRYQYLHGEHFGLAAEFSRSSSDRDTVYAPAGVARDDWSLRGRWRPVDGVVGELFASTSSLDADLDDDELETAAATFPFRPAPRRQWGGGVAARRGPLFGRLRLARPSGEGLPDTDLEVEAGVAEAPFGGLVGSWERRSWSAGDGHAARLRGWAGPWRGLSLFGDVEDFRRGGPTLPPLPPDEEGEDGAAGPGVPGGSPPAPPPRFVEGRSSRVGARFHWRGLELSAARLDLEVDSVRPLELPLDRGGEVFAAGTRAGYEAALRLPLLVLDGLALEGSGQVWERTAGPWPYLPGRSGHAALTFHDVFLPTSNLEVWFDVGVRGRDGMSVPLPVEGAATTAPHVSPLSTARPTAGAGGGASRSSAGSVTGALAAQAPATVPFYRSWYTRLQIRVVTVRIFATWENFTLRDQNLDFPDRRLPTTRAIYGVRWHLWN